MSDTKIAMSNLLQGKTCKQLDSLNLCTTSYVLADLLEENLFTAADRVF